MAGSRPSEGAAPAFLTAMASGGAEGRSAAHLRCMAATVVSARMRLSCTVILAWQLPFRAGCVSYPTVMVSWRILLRASTSSSASQRWTECEQDCRGPIGRTSRRCCGAATDFCIVMGPTVRVPVASV